MLALADDYEDEYILGRCEYKISFENGELTRVTVSYRKKGTAYVLKKYPRTKARGYNKC